MEQLVRTLTEASLYAEQRWQAQDGGVQLWVASCCLLAVIAVAVVFMLVRRESAKGESGLSSTLIEECSTRSTSSSDDSADEQGAMSLHVPRLSFSAIFNLEEFMAVAYQRGVRVTKICGGKTRKMRLLSLNRHGEVMLHKMGSAEVCTIPY
ncbi:hypothetical protein B484DRAFT_177229 [Ochromonadaceae sp. CCMP2298]|nr:hypothetical protein B484DRAFT_177229 [Ochromonadaceae sp. CCMP2298]